jgi:hypothetical protein
MSVKKRYDQIKAEKKGKKNCEKGRRPRKKSGYSR